MDVLELKTMLLIQGIKGDLDLLNRGRRSGAGPAGFCIEVDEFLVNLPLWVNDQSPPSPFLLESGNGFMLSTGGNWFPINFIPKPGFYDKTTSDGISMKKIALLHGKDCLATTLYQKCIFMDQGRGCGFCAIEGTLKSGATTLKKTPEQLLEVARQALKEGAKHITITTGTPNLSDHGSKTLSETVNYLKKHLDTPIHVQLTPPGDKNLDLLHDAGVDSMGIHMESFDPRVMKSICPGKYHLDYKSSLKHAVGLFGENQVSSFILGGLGEDPPKTKKGFEELTSMGVIPYLVPFRPLQGSQLEGLSPPDPEYMIDLYLSAAKEIKSSGLDLSKNLAGCVRCGACSALDVALAIME